jgi:hypothetical protein
MYRHVTSSVTSSTVTAPEAEEISASSAVGEGPGTSDVGDGSDTSTVGKGSAVVAAEAGSDIEAITTS